MNKPFLIRHYFVFYNDPHMIPANRTVTNADCFCSSTDYYKKCIWPVTEPVKSSKNKSFQVKPLVFTWKRHYSTDFLGYFFIERALLPILFLVSSHPRA